MLLKTPGCAAGTGVEVVGSAEMGGGVMWKERLQIFLPLPLLLFMAVFVTKDMAQVEALSLLGLGVATREEVGLMNSPHFLRIDCW